jgi:hypothetical protein
MRCAIAYAAACLACLACAASVACGAPSSPAAPAPSSPASTSPPSPAPAPAPLPPAPAARSGGDRLRAYTREDLKALEQQKSWNEILDHLEDIPPVERDETWKALAAKAVVERLKADRGSSTDWGKVLLAREAEALAQRYPNVRSAPEFIEVRGEIVVDAVRQCTAGDAWERCEWLVGLLEGDPKHALAAGHAAVANLRLALALYRVALGTDATHAKTVCADDGALKAMLDGVQRPQDSPQYRDAQAIRERCRALGKKN